MLAYLRLISTHAHGRRFRLSPGRNVIGRTHRADVRVALPSVQPRHAAIEVKEQDITVHPLAETTSVLLNGVDVAAPARLRNGDVLGIGSARFEVSIVRESDAGDSTPKADGDISVKRVVKPFNDMPMTDSTPPAASAE